jgi:hypothetical protein
MAQMLGLFLHLFQQFIGIGICRRLLEILLAKLFQRVCPLARESSNILTITGTDRRDVSTNQTPKHLRNARHEKPVASSPSGRSSSFRDESDIFQDATFNEGPSQPIRPQPVPRRPTPSPRTGGMDKTVWKAIRDANLPRSTATFERNGYAFWRLAAMFVEGLYNVVVRFCKNIAAKASESYLLIVFLFLALLAAGFISTSSGTSADYARGLIFDVQHTINHYIPYSLSHPATIFSPAEISGLERRMSSVESDIKYLKKQVAINKSSIEELKNRLPNYLLLKKKKNGDIEIPLDFWRALKNNIQTDPSLRPAEASAPKASGTSHIAYDWGKFLRQNDQELHAWHAQEFNKEWDNHISQAFKDSVPVSKQEVLQLLEQKLAEYKDEIYEEAKKIARKVYQQVEASSNSKSIGISKDDVKKISRSTFKQLISNQIEALSKVAMGKHTDSSLRRVNHFSPGLGASINPQYTTPTAGKANKSWNKLTFSGNPAPIPHPQVKAISRWEEPGDCWCAVPSEAKGGIQIAVLTPYYIYPDEVVIEHVNTDATLDNRSAPKEMELLVQLDSSVRDRVAEASEATFPDGPPEPFLDDEWVRIAKWTYDANASDNIQVFPVQIPLRDFNAASRDYIVRARSNYGHPSRTCFYRVRLHADLE